MAVPRKIGIDECHHCKKVCKEETFALQHEYVDRHRSTRIVFCSRVCMIEYFEVWENVRARSDLALRKEMSLLHSKVCPACVRRLTELL